MGILNRILKRLGYGPLLDVHVPRVVHDLAPAEDPVAVDHLKLMYATEYARKLSQMTHNTRLVTRRLFSDIGFSKWVNSAARMEDFESGVIDAGPHLREMAGNAELGRSVAHDLPDLVKMIRYCEEHLDSRPRSDMNDVQKATFILKDLRDRLEGLEEPLPKRAAEVPCPTDPYGTSRG